MSVLLAQEFRRRDPERLRNPPEHVERRAPSPFLDRADVHAGYAGSSSEFFLRPSAGFAVVAHLLTDHERNASLSGSLSQASALAGRYTYTVDDDKVTHATLSDAGIAERIRLMRERRGLTDADLAAATDRTTGGFATYLSTLGGERRKTKPTAEFVWQAARVLGVRLEWLLTGEGPIEDDLPPDPEHPARRQASLAALLLGVPREAIEQTRLQQPTRSLTVEEWFQLIQLSAATLKLRE